MNLLSLIMFKTNQIKETMKKEITLKHYRQSITRLYVKISKYDLDKVLEYRY
jgi:hypothetical protein